MLGRIIREVEELHSAFAFMSNAYLEYVCGITFLSTNDRLLIDYNCSLQ